MLTPQVVGAVIPKVGRFARFQADAGDEDIAGPQHDGQANRKVRVEIVLHPAVEAHLVPCRGIEHRAVADVLGPAHPGHFTFSQFRGRHVRAEQRRGIDDHHRHRADDVEIPIHKAAQRRRAVEGPSDAVMGKLIPPLARRRFGINWEPRRGHKQKQQRRLNDMENLPDKTVRWHRPHSGAPRKRVPVAAVGQR